MSTKTIRLTDGTDTILPESAESGSNYCKMADGTLIQWGRVSEYHQVTQGVFEIFDVTLTIPYIDGNYTVTVSGRNDTSDNYNGNFSAMILTENTFKVFAKRNTVYANSVKWQAIGRWK